MASSSPPFPPPFHPRNSITAGSLPSATVVHKALIEVLDATCQPVVQSVHLALPALAVLPSTPSVPLLSLCSLHPMPRPSSSLCTCSVSDAVLDEGIARCQLGSDFLIALAYFSIPLELLYFFLRSKVFPHRWVLLQFGLFIVLCGGCSVAGLEGAPY